VIVAQAPLGRHIVGHRSGSGRRSFTKASRGPDDQQELLREAAVYALVGDRCPATRAHLPRDVRWDADAGELEMEAVLGCDLASLVADDGALDPAAAAEVGRVVGGFHAEAGPLGDGDAPPSVWLRDGTGVDRPTPAYLGLLSGGQVGVLKALQRSRKLQAHLAALGPPVAGDLVHGDLRWENVLVAPVDAPPRVWLVDWEMGGSGERAWDVGCFAASGISAWLASIPTVPDVAPGGLVAEAALPMDAITSGLAAFWGAYRAAGPRAPRDDWAIRCAQLAAVRVVHLAFERSAHEADLHPLAVVHLQVATHMLADPGRAGRELLGIA
jgi:hypothetical protein